MRRAHEDARRSLADRLEKEAQQEEKRLLQMLAAQHEQALREKRNRQAAELAARPGISEDERAAVSVHRLT